MLTILYVDDEAALLEIGKAMIEDLGGFSVETVESALRALDKLKTASYDAIVSDYQMPGMDGIEFLKTLRGKGCRTPFIIFTGKGREEIVIEALNSGADFYLQKGGDPQAQFMELANKVRYAISRRRAEERLRESEERFRVIFDQSMAGKSLISVPEGRFLRINRAFADMLGFSLEELQQKTWIDITYPDDIPESRECIRCLLAGEKSSYRIEKRFAHRTGRIVWGDVGASLLRDAAGTPLFLITTILDITSRKQAEAALQQTSESLKNVLDSIQDGISVLDTDCRIVLVNRTMEEWYSHAMPLVGKRCYEAYYGTDHPCDPCPTLLTIRYGRMHHAVVPRGGEGGAIIGWQDLFVFPIRDPKSGAITGAIEYVRDITDKINAENALKQNEARLEALLNASSDIIRILDRDGKIVFDTATSGTVLGYPPGYSIGRSPFEFIHPDDAERVRKELAEVCRKTNTGIPTEFRMQKADGSYVWVESSGKNLIGVPGIDGIVITTRVIEERKRTEQDLEKSRSLLESAMDMAHMAKWEYDVKSSMFMFNDRFYALYGTTAEREGGYLMPAETYAREFVYPDDSHLVGEEIRKVLATHDPGFTTTIEHRIVRRDGEVRTIVVRYGVVLDTTGNVVMTHGANQDITDRKRIEDALRESEGRYRQIAGLIADFAFSCTSRDGNPFSLDWLSGDVRKVTGYKEEEIIAMNCWRHIVEEEDLPLFDQNITGLMPGGTSQCELRIRKKEGTIQWLQCYTECIRDPLIPPDGGLRLFGGCLDISAQKGAEAALRESEEAFRAVADNASEGILIADANGVHIYTNKKAAEITGYTVSELVGLGIRDLADPKEFETVVQDRFRKIIAGEPVPKRYETVIVRKDRTTVPIEVTSARTDWHGRPADLVIIRDITERKQAEQVLKESREKLRIVLDNLPDLILVHRNGRILYANPAMVSSMALTPMDVLNKPVFDYIAPEFHMQVAGAIERRMQTGEVAPYQIEIFSPVRGRRTVLVRGSVIEYDGSPAILNVLTDITDQKEMQAAVQQSEEKFRNLVETSPDMIWEIDLQGNFRYISPTITATMGYMPEAVIGKPITNLIPEEWQTNVLHTLAGGIASGGPIKPFEATARHADGREMVIEIHAARLSGPDGKPAGFLGMAHDITHIKKADEALRESATMYRTIFENTGTAMAVIEEDTTISLANSEFIRLSGYPKEEIEGKKSWTEFVVLEDRERMLTQHRLRRQKDEKALTHYEFRFVTKSGDVRDISLAIDLIPGTKRSVASLLDITERKKAEQAREEGEVQLHAILEGSPIPNFVIDRDHRVISWNRALEESTGIKAKDVLGTKEYWRAFYDHKRPCLVDLLLDGRIEQLSEMYGENVRKSTVAEGAYEVTGFFPHVGKTGRWLSAVAAPVLDSKGTVIGGVETLEDISTIKETEKSLRQSEQRYYNIIEDQTEFICRFKPDGTHVFVNEAYARYFGKSREELTGKVFRPEIPQEDRTKFRQFFASLTPEHPVDFIEHRIIMSGGEVRWQRWSDRAIFDKNGILVEYQSVGRDITDRKRADEALYRANRQLKILTSITRHDILNKVLVLLGYIQLIKNKSADPAVIRFLEHLTSATKDIQDQIEFTRIYQDLGGQEPQWQELKGLVTSQKFPASVSLSIDEKPLWIYADPMLEKVFFNLLDNSIRHGKHVTAIRVYSRETEKCLIIVWEDNGVGIPAEEKNQIFERGYGKNTGLGMFLAREILAITNMTIMENGIPGQGARFEIAVPKDGYRLS